MLDQWVRGLWYHLVTFALFVKSDIKTTLIPVSIFAWAAAPAFSVSNALHASCWILLHLLQFDVSNQTMSPEEDMNNKKDRPLPSGRITLRQALYLRWILVPVCFAYSLCYSVEVLYASIALVALTIAYDELGGHAGHFLIRNFINACGFASFEWGATLVAGKNQHALDVPAQWAVYISAGIFFTTIHAQDFKDTEGDRLIGRMTLPIAYPKHARGTVIVGLWIWTLVCISIWKIDYITAIGFLFLASWTGVRFLYLKSIQDDQVSFYIYNVWLTAAHAMPGYWKYKEIQGFS